MEKQLTAEIKVKKYSGKKVLPPKEAFFREKNCFPSNKKSQFV